MKKTVFLSAIFYFSAFCCVYSNTGDGYIANAKYSALSHLRLPVDARSAALCGAIAALAGDFGCAMSNPSLAALQDSILISVSGALLSLDRSHFFGSAVYPFHRYLSAVGVGVVQYRTGAIERRDENGIYKGFFNDDASTFMCTYAFAATNSLFLGATGKYHRHHIDTARAQAASADIGILYQPKKNIRIGLSACNIGWEERWTTGYGDRLRVSLRSALSSTPFPVPLLISTDLEWTPGNYPQGHGGFEYWILPCLCARLGTEAPNPIQAGGGIGFRVKAVSIDYAFVYHTSMLGHSHMLSISFETQSLF